MQAANIIRLFLAALSGVVGCAAFAPLAWWPALALSLLLLWQLWYARPSQAALCGFFWGLGHFGVGVYWLFNSFYYFGGAHWLAAGLMTFSFVIYLSIFPALAGMLWAGAERSRLMRYRFMRLMILAGLWWLMEFARTSVVFGGFPWLASGFSQMSGFAAPWYPVIGADGVGWLYVLAIAAIHIGVRRWWGRAPTPTPVQSAAEDDTAPRRSDPLPAALAARTLAGTVLVCALVYLAGLALPSWTYPDADTVTVSVMHTNMPQEEKFRTSAATKALEGVFELSRQAGQGVVVWPETAIPFHADGVGQSFLRRADRLAERHDLFVLTGIFYRTPGKVYNAVYGTANGHGSYYLKQRLVPFGEFTPARWLFGFLDRWVDIPQSDLSAGPVPLAPFKQYQPSVHASVCFELFIADVIHHQARSAGLLVSVSNDAWFGRAVAPAQGLEMARVRAAETGRALARASNQGISAIIDWRGNVLVSADGDDEMISAEVAGRRGLTPIVRFGQNVILALIVFISLAAWATAHWLAKRPAPSPRR